MNKRNNNYYFIALIVICIGLLLWIEPKKNSTKLEREGENTSPASMNNVSENEKYSIQVPYYWKEQIDEYNRIEATIKVPDCIREEGFQKASAEIVVVNQENLLSLLEEYYHPQKGIEDEQVIQYLGKDNMYLYFFKSSEGGVSLTTSFRNYVAMAYHEELTEEYNRDLYPVDEELENFPIVDCDDMILNFCESIGISGEINIIHRTLDYEMMKYEAEEMQPDGTKTKPDYQWTPNDSSYYCTISQLCNGIAIIPVFYLNSYADILNVGGHTCLLNKERIASFYIDNIYNIRYGETHEELMEFSDVVEKYGQYVSLARQDYETVITDITMRVLAINQGNGSYNLTPVWVFYGYWSDTAEDITGYHAIFINAITGERL